MNTRTLATLALRVLAVYLFLRPLVQLPRIAANLRLWFGPMQDTSAHEGLFVAGLFAIAFCAAVILWFAAPGLARCMIRGASGTLSLTNASTTRLVEATFGVVGVLLLVTAVPNLVSLLVQGVTLFVSPHSSTPGTGPRLAASFAHCTVQVLLALALIAGRQRLAALLDWLRYAGTHADEQAAEED